MWDPFISFVLKPFRQERFNEPNTSLAQGWNALLWNPTGSLSDLWQKGKSTPLKAQAFRVFRPKPFNLLVIPDRQTWEEKQDQRADVTLR